MAATRPSRPNPLQWPLTPENLDGLDATIEDIYIWLRKLASGSADGEDGDDGAPGPPGRPGVDGAPGRPGPPASASASLGRAPLQGFQAPGSFVIATGKFGLHGKRLKLTGTQRGTLQGTARLVISG